METPHILAGRPVRYGVGGVLPVARREPMMNDGHLLRAPNRGHSFSRKTAGITWHNAPRTRSIFSRCGDGLLNCAAEPFDGNPRDVGIAPVELIRLVWQI